MRHMTAKGWGLLVCAILIGVLGHTQLNAQATASQTPPPPATANTGSQQANPIVATVNGQAITRQSLGVECLQRHGEQLLERLVNKFLIKIECDKKGIAVTQADVAQEIKKEAEQFELSVEQWLQLLEENREIDPDQYANEVVWPRLALQRLVADQLTVSEEEIRKAFETQYGPAVQCRMIVCKDQAHADDVMRRLNADPSSFAEIAKNESTDKGTAAQNGLIYTPIRLHSGPAEIERVIFSLQPSQISQPVLIGEEPHIFLCTKKYPAADVELDADMRVHFERAIRDRKMGSIAGKVFQQLQATAQVRNVLNDPVASRQMPGVAAVVNNTPVSTAELAEECIKRHGEDILNDMIHHLLLLQECSRRNITVTPQEIDAEIARNASLMLPLKEDGTPNSAKWVEMITERQSVTEGVYRQKFVWPSVALKKLVDGQVVVTEEDLRKSFESNYGPKVLCLAIVSDSQRHALEVFDQARQDKTEENFQRLAARYSIAHDSKVNEGAIPPIQRHSGNPTLEEAAFALKPGDISGIIHLGAERYVILYCIEHLQPEDYQMSEVRDFIYNDIYEKKLRVEMEKVFSHLVASATIENKLTGEVITPRPIAQGPAAIATPAATGGAPQR